MRIFVYFVGDESNYSTSYVGGELEEVVGQLYSNERIEPFFLEVWEEGKLLGVIEFGEKELMFIKSLNSEIQIEEALEKAFCNPQIGFVTKFQLPASMKGA